MDERTEYDLWNRTSHRYNVLGIPKKFLDSDPQDLGNAIETWLVDSHKDRKSEIYRSWAAEDIINAIEGKPLASSPVAGLQDYLRDRRAAGEITLAEAEFAIKGVNDWLTRPGYPQKLVAKLRQLIADQNWATITQGFYREVEFGTAGKRGTQVDAQGDVLPGPNYINDYTVAEYTLGLARYLLKTGQQGRGVVLGGDTRIKSILPYRGEPSYTELQAQILRKMGIKVYRFKEPRSIGHVAWTTVNLDAASMEYNSASHNMWMDNGVKASNEFGAQLFADERSGILEKIKGVAPEDISALHLEGFNLEQDRRENPGMHILLGSRQDQESDLSVVDAGSGYIEANRRYVENMDVIRRYSPQVHSFYTPIQGAGIYTIPDILTGGDDFKFHVVISQKQRSQDSEGRFNTVEKPDPNYVNEKTGARTLDLAIQEAEAMEKSSGIKFDFVFGTDPDADRSSYAVRDREGTWNVLKANDVWSLFAWYRLTQLARQGKLKAGTWAIETWVTTDLIAEIVQDPQFNLRVLKPAVGFNKIAEVALREIVLPVLVKRHGGVDLKELQRTKVLTLDKLAGVFGVSLRKEMMGEINAILREFLLFGAEESNGYSPGGHTLEKDGAVAAVTFHEIAAFVKYINHNKEEAGRDDPFLKSYFSAFAGKDLTIDELLNRVYLQYGYYATENKPRPFGGLIGNAQKAKVLQGIAELAARVNEGEETVTIGGKRVQKAFSGKEQASTANVQFNEVGYKFMLGEKDYIVTRPSGTEPYIRFYGQKYVSALELNWNNIEDQKEKVDHEIEEIVLAAQRVLSPVSSLAGASQIRDDEEEGFSPPAEGAVRDEIPPDASSQASGGESVSSPVSFKGISQKAGEKLFDIMPLTEEERSKIEMATVMRGEGLVYERQAFVVLPGGRHLKVYLTPKTVRALEDAVKAGNSVENTVGEEFDRLNNETTDPEFILDEVRMAGKGSGLSSSPMAGDTFRKGGIDLNPALLDLQIKRDGNGVPLPLPMQPIENMHIEGFLPIIINVTPITNLPLLLGLADTESDTEETRPTLKAREPEEISSLTVPLSI